MFLVFLHLFPRFWIIFTIITLNSFSGRLPILSWFIWSCRFLPCSFVCNNTCFWWWCCIPVLLVVWPETSSTGVCRQLDRAGSWCWDEDLWEASIWLMFPGVWGSLLVQRFGLGAPTTGAQARHPAWDPRSCKLRGAVRKERKKEKRSSTISKNKKQIKIRKIKNILGKIKL